MNPNAIETPGLLFMTARHLIVTRQSPDWMTFDLASSITFMRELRFPENLIVDFVGIWDAEFSLTYRQVRAALKTIATDNHHKVQNADVISIDDLDLAAIRPDDVIMFVDDDDWFSEKIVTEISEHVIDDGLYWNFVRIGKRFSLEESLLSSDFLTFYPPERRIWTNNYAVSGRALIKYGLKSLQEHSAANAIFNDPTFTAQSIDKRLSCTVKHPCSTMSIKYHMSLPDLRNNLRTAVFQYVGGLREITLGDELSWMRSELAALSNVMEEVIRS